MGIGGLLEQNHEQDGVAGLVEGLPGLQQCSGGQQDSSWK